MCTHVRQNFWKVSSNSKHHSKPTMNINSQQHNLLGNQLSPKSEDFCIWRPFCTLVTMATAAILNLFNLQKLPHTTVDIPTKWIIIWLPNHGYQFPTSKSTWKPNFSQIGGFLYFGGHFRFKMAAIANQRWISIRNIIIYLETKFRPNRRIFFYFGRHFGFKMVAIANQRLISIRNIIIYLETIFRPNRRIFVCGGHFCTLVTMATASILNVFNP